MWVSDIYSTYASYLLLANVGERDLLMRLRSVDNTSTGYIGVSGYFFIP